MPCVEPNSTLPESKIKLILQVIHFQEQDPTIEEIVKQTNQPLFEIRSILRETIRLGYITAKNNRYMIT
ncbi:hypothetical protein [Alteribacillus bidgolensis]|uniref:Uncharacterized protein n=1 Tax=Alteribacillus bidgolensis TaxID=930129 RepID=A0A1G8R8C6_9BACI|nr:hypothetical protein [Alteribacillus bidgolensis]SDJ12775.1 hypothetical protein SAMN05216352_12519 [Alteribacillus bidgolensis]